MIQYFLKAPVAVKLSWMFLLALFLLMCAVAPATALGVILAALVVLALVTIIEYSKDQS